MHPVILAAGRGSRLGAITDDRPKLFVRIDGRSIYERQVEVLDRYFDEASVVLGHGFEEAEPSEIDERLDVGNGMTVEHVFLEEWASVENAASLRAAIDRHRAGGSDRDDLLVLCGDVVFADEALRRIVETFEGTYRDEGYNGVGCVRGWQDEMTAVRFDDRGEITAYGAIAGHREIGAFVLHERYLDEARQLLAANQNEWFPFIFERLPSKRILVPPWSQHEINTPEHLEQANDRLPFEPVTTASHNTQ